MIALLLSAALMAAAPAAAEAPSQPGAAAKSDKSKKDGLVCKREALVGSRLKTRICMTQAEWDERKANAKSDIDRTMSGKGPIPEN